MYIDNEAVLHSTISVMAHDISLPRPPSSIMLQCLLFILTNNKIAVLVCRYL